MQNTIIVSKSAKGGGLDSAGGRFRALGLSRSAFTLAEVLITLGIIGVVAAMTLPILTAKYQERVLVTRAKKTYSTILAAINTYKADNEVFDVSGLFDTNNTSLQTLQNFSKYFKVSMICDTKSNGCQGKYKVKKTKRSPDGKGGTAMLTPSSSNPRMSLTDGSIIWITQYSNCNQYYETGSNKYDEDGNLIESNPWTRTYCASLCFDTNGKQKPNQAGQDYFCFGVKQNGTIYDHNTTNTGSITSVLANDKLNDVENYSEGAWK